MEYIMKSMSRVSKILTSVTKMDFLIAEKRKNAFLAIFKSDYLSLNFRIPRPRIIPWLALKGNPKAYPVALCPLNLS